MKKIFLMILVIALSFTLNYGQVAPAAGSGTAVDPYEISTFDNLLWIQADIARWGFHYKQTANITASPGGSENWDRIGDNGDPFTGSYNGQGNTVDGLFIILNAGSSNQRGFFGVIDGATIENVGVTNISLTNASSIGALVGESRGGTISNCYATGSVNGNGLHIGGLIGWTKETTATTISDCYSECTVANSSTNDYSYTGGFVGGLRNATVTNCYATGSVAAESGGNGTSVGGFVGIVGETTGSTISKCYATGNVLGGSTGTIWTPSGGFVGYNIGGSTISESYSLGNVESFTRAGGFVGYNRYGGTKIENCYSLGNVTRKTGSSDTHVGGFLGRNNSSAIISKCYSIGSVTYTDATDPTDKGFVATLSSGTVSDCFFDREASNQTTDVAAVGETTINMKDETIYLTATNAWDFTAGTGIWQINVDGATKFYPDLQSNENTTTPLPVELTLFTAESVDGGVLLNWETATEVNNYGFDIEASNDGETFNKVGFVDGHGNSNSPKQYSFVDASTSLSASYRLKQIDTDGSFEYSDVVTVVGALAKTELYQNHPNPFNPSTVISFSLSSLSDVNVSVFNILGQKVAELVNSKMEAGNHSVNFNASELTSGVYVYRIDTPNYTKSMKMLLIK